MKDAHIYFCTILLVPQSKTEKLTPDNSLPTIAYGRVFSRSLIAKRAFHLFYLYICMSPSMGVNGQQESEGRPKPLVSRKSIAAANADEAGAFYILLELPLLLP